MAIATPAGGAARGVVRLSGPHVAACVVTCFEGPPLQKATRASVFQGSIRLPAPLGEIPCDLYYWPNPRSYTRQPSAEIHTLGSPPLLEAIVRQLCAGGARLAQPGEFTLRAFLAGRVDLPQAEAVLGVIDAENRRQLDIALAQMAGGLSGRLNQLRDRLLDLLAHIEAGLDFAEEDIEFVEGSEIQRQLSAAQQEIRSLREQMSRRGRTGEANRVALWGRPNVGKSSLLNALAQDQAALVSPTAGATRDYLWRSIDCDGVVCVLIDMAGVEEAMASATPEPPALAAGLAAPMNFERGLTLTHPTLARSAQAQDEVAAAAQSMAGRQADQADLRLLCLDCTLPLHDWELEQLHQESTRRLVVWTKVDAASPGVFTDAAARYPPLREALPTSSHSGEGVEQLRRAIGRFFKETSHAESSVVAATAQRCSESLRLTAKGLERAERIHAAQQGEELVAAEIRQALTELGKTVGAVYTDDVLDRIFSRFCIGK